ncbi:MAG: prepilin-type N-terminal cleavage/methylation domain-containing protein [Candidatus Thiodiazotropha taylori]|uniref:Prepilin-type N-terminal cleavage/methylation domain-containing protein n=1 Tax=Candidatus Thiodiazotropha taylori TaxID=2792791 RepID=A0A9E4TAP1_9GAMM|nr:prepilin-type N-terminal cleavage/methylation domain-containing protein [Candidatus Thiodiazotropha taylori]MCW4259137.1 prepilin-type N-terminal cleavage/methylation domain-containing protein [Candidatus Thiodiazotropha taylori]
MNNNIRKLSGFTLVELMVAVTIIGILLSIVIPNYMESVRKSRYNDGMNSLTDAAMKMETVRARTGSYPATLAEANISATSTEGYYGNLIITAPSAACPLSSCYLLQIDGQEGQEHSNVTAYRLFSTGQKQRLQGGVWEEGWK